MIEIHIGTGEIMVKGHAGYNPGNDIVCSAVSTLIYTAVNYIEEHRENFISAGYRLCSGDTEIRYVPAKKRQQVTEAVMKAITDGLGMIAENYPENVIVLGRDEKDTLLQ